MIEDSRTASYPGLSPVREPPRSAGAGARARWLIAAVTVAGAAAAVVHLPGRLPEWDAVSAAIGLAAPGWIAVAALAQVASLVVFGLQQRFVLGWFGVSVPVKAAVGLATVRSAMAIGLPGGSALSAAYAYRRCRRWGATAATASVTIVVSNGLTVVALGLIYALGAVGVLVGRAAGPDGALLLVGGIVLLAVAAGCWGRVWRMPAVASSTAGRAPADGGRVGAGNGFVPEVRRSIAMTWQLPPRLWVGAVALSVANWCADVGCLVAVGLALGLDVGLVPIAGMYLGIQVVRQLPLAPGGIGLIEAGLLAGLTAAGVGTNAAGAAVLCYRLLSCWFVILAGLIVSAVSRYRGPQGPPSTADGAADPR